MPPGAIGTAVSVTILSSRAATLAEDGAGEATALVGGLQWAFGLGAVVALAVVGLALLLPRHAPEGAPAGAAH